MVETQVFWKSANTRAVNFSNVDNQQLLLERKFSDAEVWRAWRFSKAVGILLSVAFSTGHSRSKGEGKTLRKINTSDVQ